MCYHCKEISNDIRARRHRNRAEKVQRIDAGQKLAKLVSILLVPNVAGPFLHKDHGK